ncbi:hypothetical protein G6F16_004744 [Rhizopus arrhizus]|nr:hypothetical protein G6F24_003193 [Rhizopus arrhizus]KAG0817302.1 hypothetical protein G6F20_002498 [Rhizopus arrhizus]KAG0841400.1 hypothetical protein G6F19_001569 [Rhizopus arrhizus]KAG0843431.1 hypothetical protein G6F18_002359 [Rhizopus arrhizus]KAG0873078.1 hypothetical protein G6F16_004744 [Rhizopus arrhizus]
MHFESNVGVVPYLVILGTLFFNASGTAGNQVVEMILNIVTMLFPAIWCAIISYLCTLYNSNNQGLYWNGTGAIASIAFFLSVFLTAYYRLKYPRLFIPALQGFTLPFFGLTKGIYDTHFDVMSIVGIFYPVLIGGAIALLVNLVLWPETAAKLSETSFGNALSSIQDVLEFIEQEVLKDSDNDFSDLSASKKLHQYIQKLDGDISKMQVARKEAKYEIVVSHYRPIWYKSFAATLDSLSRYLYGFSLTVEREGEILESQKSGQHKENGKQDSIAIEIEQQMLRIDGRGAPNYYTNSTNISQIEYKLISQLQSSVQPQLRRFIQICISVLNCIQFRLEENDAIPRRGKVPREKTIDHLDLKEALRNLKEAKIILENEYQQRKAEPIEDHFMIYTILFTLTQFGNKLFELEEQANNLIAKRKGRFPRIFFPRVPLKKWLGQAGQNAKGERTVTEQVLFDQRDLLQREESRHNMATSSESTSSEPSTAARYKPSGPIEKRLSIESDWIDDKDVLTPLQNSPGTHFWNRYLQILDDWIRTDPVRYAIKFAVTMELLALMSWLPIEGVNELYNNNHGQWALLSAMVVFNFTVGSTALQCLFRVLATIIGAVCGYICLLAGNRNQNPYVVAVLICVFQIPMWYMLLGSKYPRIGFISLLTMAVITSTGYSDRYNEDLFAPVWKRTLTAIFAIILVIIVDQLLWPVWARKMVRKHLSDLLIATGIQYSKVASLVCQENTQSYRYKSTLCDVEINAKVLRRQHQLTCQMLGLAQMEPRLTKGPFPISVYKDILEHEKHVLYWISHLLETQSFVTSDVRCKIMNPMNPYRRELAAAVHLYLYTLACSLRTKSSLPASLPSAETARKLLQKRQAILWHNTYNQMDEDGEKTQVDEKSAENQVYWQTYAAGTIEVIAEQEAMGKLVAKLMGQHVFKAATKDWIG